MVTEDHYFLSFKVITILPHNSEFYLNFIQNQNHETIYRNYIASCSNQFKITN